MRDGLPTGGWREQLPIPTVKARDDELMSLYPHVPTYEALPSVLAFRGRYSQPGEISQRQKLTGCRRKPMTKTDRTKACAPVEEIAPVSQGLMLPDVR